jgi:hypothetical protein
MFGAAACSSLITWYPSRPIVIDRLVSCVPVPGKLHALDVQSNGVSVDAPFSHLLLIFKPLSPLGGVSLAVTWTCFDNHDETSMRPLSISMKRQRPRYVVFTSSSRLTVQDQTISFRTPPRTASTNPTQYSKLFAVYPVGELHTRRSRRNEASMVHLAVLLPSATSQGTESTSLRPVAHHPQSIPLQ